MFSINQDIRPITDFKRHSKDILKQLHESQRPLILTVNGRTEAVMIDSHVFEEMQRTINLLKLVKPAEDDIASGHTRSASLFFEEFKIEKKIRNVS